MKFFAIFRGSLPVAKTRQPSGLRLCSTKEEKPASDETSSATAQPDNKFGFNDWSEINPDTKTIDTAVGPLPISPFLDPKWRKARDRNKKKRARPSKEKLDRFQQLIYKNQYAQLLAQPVRSCHITRTRLPKPFLQDFGLVKHPEADELWWIPADFKQDAEEDTPEHSEDATKQAENDDISAISSSDTTLSQAAASTEITSRLEPGSQAAPRPSTTPAPEVPGPLHKDIGGPPANKRRSGAPARKGKFFAPAHTLARRDLLLEFFNRKSKYSFAYMRFAINPSIAGLVRAAAWRQDMDEVISDQLRRQIVGELIYLAQLCETGGRRYLFAMDTDQARADKHTRRSCFLSFGSEGELFDVLETEGMPTGVCPVYYAPKLLGSENVDHLRTKSALFRGVPMVLLRGRRTYELNKKLWRLQGFLADYNKLK